MESKCCFLSFSWKIPWFVRGKSFFMKSLKKFLRCSSPRTLCWLWTPKLSYLEVLDLGGGFKDFLFSPLLGEMIKFGSYFSNGLKPPTSGCLMAFCWDPMILMWCGALVEGWEHGELGLRERKWNFSLFRKWRPGEGWIEFALDVVLSANGWFGKTMMNDSNSNHANYHGEYVTPGSPWPPLFKKVANSQFHHYFSRDFHSKIPEDYSFNVLWLPANGFLEQKLGHLFFWGEK